MKKLLGIVAALGLSTAVMAGGMAKKDIVDTAVDAGTFDTLVTAIKAADLVDTFKGEGPYTVFAPSDEAFSALPAGTVEDLLKPENKDKLAELLNFHVVAGKVMAADITGETTIAKSIKGVDLTLNAMAGVKINESTVIEADIEALNGVIHKIDKVIIPENWPGT